MKYQFRTWHAESAVVAVALLATVLLSNGAWVEWIGAGAVWCQFSHAQIAERLREQEAARPTPSVECHKKLGWYFTGKEVLWFWYFMLSSAWSALAGCALFILYPIWRKWWRKRHPIPKVYQILDPDLWERINSGERLFASVGSTHHPFNMADDTHNIPAPPPPTSTPTTIPPQSVLDYIRASNAATVDPSLQDEW